MDRALSAVPPPPDRPRNPRLDKAPAPPILPRDRPHLDPAPRPLTPAAPDWIDRAERVAQSFRATSHRARGAGHSVYVILLFDDRRPDPFGLYVGQTSRDPDLRFDQHKDGYKASGAVRRFGIRLLPALTAHLNPMRRWEAVEIEEALAEAFVRAGVPWVEGGH